MSPINCAFDVLLGVPESGWQEANLQIAADKLKEFSETDWHELAGLVLNKPIYWQERCAEAAGMVEGESAVSLLMILINSQSLQVASIAASELDNISAALPRRLERRLMEIIKYLDDCQSPRMEDVIGLLGRLD